MAAKTLQMKPASRESPVKQAISASPDSKRQADNELDLLNEHEKVHFNYADISLVSDQSATPRIQRHAGRMPQQLAGGSPLQCRSGPSRFRQTAGCSLAERHGIAFWV